jgi:hypothetical protein
MSNFFDEPRHTAGFHILILSIDVFTAGFHILILSIDVFNKPHKPARLA